MHLILIKDTLAANGIFLNWFCLYIPGCFIVAVCARRNLLRLGMFISGSQKNTKTAISFSLMICWICVTAMTVLQETGSGFFSDGMGNLMTGVGIHSFL